MKTILVPTDFSNAATNAAEYAVCLAREIGARVRLFHVYHVPATDMSLMVQGASEFEEVCEKYLKRLAGHLEKRSGVEVEILVKMGSTVDSILEEEENANLVIMGMKGAGKLHEVLMGSTTTATLRRSAKPVLVIPEDSKYRKPEKVVFAFDYDPRTDTDTLNTLKSLMKSFGSKIYVVNVKLKSMLPVEKSIEGISLENILNDIDQSWCFTKKKDLVESINEFAEDQHADMVAIIPRRYSLMDRLFHENDSKKMAFHTQVPLLAVPENHQSNGGYFL